ncbi:MAG TPA: NAD(P)H-quinone oxidoreductase [Candidatus Dormibacteraeota bacterium]|nr:NAD(P)H-quinone oxidoreductase [Candidatus Dormibacteraeota bacterium]
MRAIVFDQPGDESVLHIGEVPAPALGANDVRIRVRATAVNRADLLQRQGFYPPPAGASAILGLECGGEIAEVGSAVRGWKVGERAMALLAGGGYAEEVVVDAGAVMRVPAALSDEEGGAFAEVFLTAFLNIFMLGAVPDGGSVLVHGGGSGVGTAAITLCREAGVRIIVTAGSAEKCARCRAHGADVAINYRDGDFAPAVRAATNDKGVDVVLDAIGARYLESNLAALAMNGRLVVIGLMGGTRAELDLAGLMVKRQQVIGSTLRVRPAAEKAAIVDAFRARFGAALDAGRIRPVIDRVLPLAEAGEAHRIMKASEHFGKLALRVG